MVWDIPILETIHAVHQERLDLTAYTVTQLARGSTIFAIAGLISLGINVDIDIKGNAKLLNE